MKVLHTSDWHLGRMLHGYSLIEDQQYILERLLEYTKEQEIDLLIIAGDVYDKSQPSDEAIRLFNEFLSRIILDQKIPTVIIAGNHDSGTKIHFGSSLFESQNLHIIGQCEEGYKYIPLSKNNESIDIYMIPYMTPGIVRDIAKDDTIRTHEDSMNYVIDQIKSTKREVASIVIAHAFVAGGDSSDSEKNLCAVGTAELVGAHHFKDFTYTALGHLHKPQKVGQEYIRYSGSLLKYSTSEAGHTKGVTLVHIENDTLLAIENISLQTKRDLRIVTDTLENIITQATLESVDQRDDYIFAKIIGEPTVDVMGTLKKVYSRVLGVEFISEREVKKTTNQEIEEIEYQRSKSASELFMEFIDYLGDVEFEKDEREYIEQIIRDIEEGEY